MDIRKLAEFERLFNDKLMGSASERHRVKVLPKGFHPQAMPTVDERYKADYDEFIIKRIGSAFGVSPSQLGVIPRSGLGGKGEHDGEMDQSETVSLKPMVGFITEVINSLCRRYLGADKNVTFAMQDSELVQNQVEQAKALQTSVFSGAKTLNDVRGELGLPLYEMPEADEPFLETPNGPVYLRGTLLTTTSGETVEQKDDTNGELLHVPNEEGQSPQGQEAHSEGAQSEGSQGNKPQEPVSPSKEAHAELTAYKKFVKARVAKGTWRDFVFHTVDPETAAELNAEGQAKVLKGADPDPFYSSL